MMYWFGKESSRLNNQISSCIHTPCICIYCGCLLSASSSCGVLYSMGCGRLREGRGKE